MGARILIIEDEVKVADALAAGLTDERYDTVIAHTGEEGFFQANERAMDLIILDLMLPGRDGLEVLTNLRRRGLRTPVLVLTARDAIADRVLGLDAGADDYMVKPFAFAELLARIRALLRRGRTDDTLRLVLADLEMDLVTRRVTRASVPIDLRAREFELLEYLLRSAGKVITRDTLARELWPNREVDGPLSNVIEVHIARLRQKVDDPFGSRLIRTVRGVGYTIREGPV